MRKEQQETVAVLLLMALLLWALVAGWPRHW